MLGIESHILVFDTECQLTATPIYNSALRLTALAGTSLRDFSPTQLTTMTQDIEQIHIAAERRVKVKAVCKEPRDTTKH